MNIDKKDIEAIYLLSPLQTAILSDSLNNSKAGAYCEQLVCDLHAKLDVSVLGDSWQYVVNNHPVLRTFFVWKRLDRPLQIVHKQLKVSIEKQDWCCLSPAQQQERLEIFLQIERNRGFNPSEASLIRLNLLQISEDVHQLICTYHRLVLDYNSLYLILTEIFDYYKVLCKNGRELQVEQSRPYQDYVTWLKQQDISKAEIFWSQVLKEFPTSNPLRVIRNYNKSSAQKNAYAEQQLEMSAVATTNLQSFADKHQINLSTLVQGAWALLLSRYSGETDIVFGTTVSGRPLNLEGSESMIGSFVNTLPLCVVVLPNASVLPWLKELQAQQVNLHQYEYNSLLQIRDWINVADNLPLFESSVVFDNSLLDSFLQKHSKDIKICKIQTSEQISLPISVKAQLTPNLVLKITYDACQFDSATIIQILKHIQTLLDNISAHPEQCLATLPFLTELELKQLFSGWSILKNYDLQAECIHQLFETQVEQTPDAIAVVFNDKYLTYRDLNCRANQLAHYLQRLGLGSEALVGICIERSLEMLIGILGILKAGGAYVPLEPSYPQARLDFMLKDTQVSVILTQSHLIDKLLEHQAQVIYLDTDWLTISKFSPSPVTSPVTPENLAYVIYTSGSTGQPKGAMNTHLGICNRILWMQDEYKLNQSDRVLQKTPFSFDVSVWEFFWPLMTGATLVVAKPEGHKDPAYLVDLITQQQITTLHFVPSMLHLFLEHPGIEKCDSIKRVMCSGEALPYSYTQKFFNCLPHTELHNLYGPTEAAVDVTFYACPKDNEKQIVPIGRPIANTQIYILDSHLQPVPVGLPGELYIGGVGVGRGYLNRPELTAEKFIFVETSHTKSLQRLYKTGDLARYLPDGNIEYIGRVDNQVKIRGFRIELGEIEVVLRSHPDVQETVVTASEPPSGHKRLVAYVIPNQDREQLLPDELRSFLKEKLPEYMVPSTFVILDTLPLTPNGKIDRHALPTPEMGCPRLSLTFAIPRTPIEELLAGIWSEVLEIDQVGIYDNFFELGGHSLLATQLISRVRDTLAVELPLHSLFEKPTIARLAECLETMSREPKSSNIVENHINEREEVEF